MEDLLVKLRILDRRQHPDAGYESWQYRLNKWNPISYIVALVYAFYALYVIFITEDENPFKWH